MIKSEDMTSNHLQEECEKHPDYQEYLTEFLLRKEKIRKIVEAKGKTYAEYEMYANNPFGRWPQWMYELC